VHGNLDLETGTDGLAAHVALLDAVEAHLELLHDLGFLVVLFSLRKYYFSLSYLVHIGREDLVTHAHNT